MSYLNNTLTQMSLIEEILLLDSSEILTLVDVSFIELESQISNYWLTLLNIDYPEGVDPILYTQNFFFEHKDVLFNSQGDVLLSINYERLGHLQNNKKIEEINSYLIQILSNLQAGLIDATFGYPVKISKNVYKLILMPNDNLKINNNWNFFVENTYVMFSDNQYSLKNI